MKKTLSMAIASITTLALALTACGAAGGAQSTAGSASTAADSANGSAKETSITLWTYPIGQWQKQDTVNGFIKKFNEKHPEIKVNVEYLDYKSGDDKVTTAIETKNTPDIIFEGPERLVANWGAKGLMVDLSDMFTDETKADIEKTSKEVLAACQTPDGKFYEYPMTMTAHTMAINYDVFKQADALKYIDEETRSWTTENFEKALKAVKDSGLVQYPAIVYAGGQGGDQGTRALVTNLYDGKYTDEGHTKYTADSAENIKALEKIQQMHKDGLVNIDPSAQASDELQLFANGTTAISLAWNAANEMNYASQTQFTPFAMNFPSDDGKAELSGGIWGFGIFDNGDQARIDAAKEFIRFIADDAEQGPASVAATGFFPVRSSFGNVYENTDNADRMKVFSSFLPNLGDYYNVTKGWTEQRTAWWNMLQQIGSGKDVKEAANEFVTTANAAAAK